MTISRARPLSIGPFALLLLFALPTTALAQGTLFVESDKVGIGIATPADFLHIRSTTAGRTFAFIQNTSGPELVGSRYQNSLTTWDFRMDGVGDFIFDNTATGGEELKIRQNGEVRVGPAPASIVMKPDGDIFIEGTLTEGSSRSLKHDFRRLDGRAALAKLSKLDVLEWSYKNQETRHLGPMAEDFHDLFRLGHGPDTLAPRDVASVALLALQGLNEVVEDKDEQLEELRAEVHQLRALVTELTSQTSE